MTANSGGANRDGQSMEEDFSGGEIMREHEESRYTYGYAGIGYSSGGFEFYGGAQSGGVGGYFRQPQTQPQTPFTAAAPRGRTARIAVEMAKSQFSESPFSKSPFAVAGLLSCRLLSYRGAFPVGPSQWGLAALHKSRICHRDLKPQNLLLKAKGEVLASATVKVRG